MMKITLRFVGLNPRATWHRLVERQLNYLQSLTAMTAAQAVLVHLRDARPAFRVLVLLEGPGPDLHAEACDHTLEAALLKATQNLEQQIQARKTRRMERGKSHLQLSPSSSQWTHAWAGRTICRKGNLRRGVGREAVSLA